LESEVVAAKENLEALRASHGSALSEAAAAAAVEHEALIKAHADLTAIAAETQTLKITHAQASEEAMEKLKVIESKAARSEDLEVQLVELKAEKAENSHKLSELEIEVLELKESQEAIEEERKKSLAHLNSVEEALANAVTGTQQAIEDAKAKEVELARQAEDTRKLHGDELKAAADEHAKMVADLEALKAELAEAQAAYEQANADAHAAIEDHARKLDEAEKGYLSKQTELSDEIQRITTEFEVSLFLS
jgi:chromosome segregation ATPase